MEWLEEWQRRHAFWNWQELEAHLEVRLNLKHVDPVLDCCRGGSALGQSLWLW